VMNCAGSITVPNSYGSSSTTTYTVDPIYNGSNGYGFMFTGYATGPGPSFSGGAAPNWCNPGINQRQRIQLLQALALFTLPAGAAYNAGTAYVPGNYVTNGGQDWLCLANSTGVTPVAGANWALN